jgi:ribosome-associated protein YbcJ (S4-like RNA binding protein)
MSHRPIHEKKMRRLRKTVARRSLPAFIDLIQYLKSRNYADTTGQAVRLLVDGKVRVDSHIIGRERARAVVGRVVIGDKVVNAGKEIERWEPRVYVPASMRASIQVTA